MSKTERISRRSFLRRVAMAAAGAAVAGCTRKKEGLPPLEEAKPYREQQPATSTPTATATEKWCQRQQQQRKWCQR